MLYDGEFVENPYALQLRTAWRLLFSPRKPMTLFFVHDVSLTPGTDLDEAPAVRLLHAAIRSFLSSPVGQTIDGAS